LVTVQSLARNSLRTGDREATGFTAFEDRLLALSAAHNVLTLEDWAFAEVQKIVMGAIKPYLAPDPAARFEVEGDPLRLQPHAGLALAMALHELATNAVKHGALSSQRGRVRIRWWQTRDGECGRALFRLGWTETGGPRVAPPTWRGFGSRLIEEGLAQDLDGLVDLRFEPSGLVCAISAPLDGIVAGDEGPAISAENAVVQKN
jgi:two-component sensor histidine kinase